MQPQPILFVCPLCRALSPSGETCEERFYQGQALEIEHPDLYTVHNLSVPSYMLQHNLYSQAGWLGARELLEQFLHGGLTPAMARRQNKQKLDSGQRHWSITRGPKTPGADAITWSFTVFDVSLAPERYCQDVRRWAESILEDSAPLVRALKLAKPGSS